MVEDGWSPYFVLICDDIRLESTGKHFIIGLYNEIMIVAGVPVVMSSLALRIAVRLHRTNFKESKFELKSPTGSVVASGSSEVNSQTMDEYVPFVFAFQGLVLSHIGEYTIHFGLDGPLRNVGRLIVRLPETDQERHLLSR